MTIILETHNLCIGYRSNTPIATGITTTLNSGELVCLIGPNGAGKSTLLRTLAGMQKPLSGTVRLQGDDVTRLKPSQLARRLSIVLTTPVQNNMMSGYELVALGRHPYTDWMGRITAHDEAVIRWAIEAVGATDLATRQPGELSDGERQKMMIARALAQEPVLMLLDEPTAFLDLPYRIEIIRLLRQLARDTERTILLTSHDLDLALRTSNRIWLMPGNGLLHTGAPEDLVLSGAFERAFHSQNIHFDLHSGTFKIDTPHTMEVRIKGEGIHAVWTRRALEREGFAVIENGDAPHAVTVEVNETCWRIIRDNTPHNAEDYESIHDLMIALKYFRENR